MSIQHLTARLANVLRRVSWRTLAICALSGILFAWASAAVAHRWKQERANNRVELCLDHDEVEDLCARNGYPAAVFLERCRAIGVASIALSEETFDSLEDDGKIIAFPRPDYLRFRMLDLMSAGSAITGDVILTDDRKLLDRLVRQFGGRYHVPVRTSRAGKYHVIASTAGAFGRLLAAGDLPLGFPDDLAAELGDLGFSVVLRPRNSGDPAWMFERLPGRFSAFLWDGRETPGYPGGERMFGDELARHRTRFVHLEFAGVLGAQVAAVPAAEYAVRGHAVSDPELNRNASHAHWLARWRRAARERGIRFFYFHFYDRGSIEDNLAYLRSTAQTLKKDGFVLGAAEPPRYPARDGRQLWLSMTLLVAVCAPLISLSGGRRFGNPVAAYLVTNAVSVAGGLLVAALLYDLSFLQKLQEIPSVKLAMFLPVLLSVFLLFPVPELRKFWSRGIAVKHLVIGAAVLAVLGIIAARSGNQAAEWLHPDHGLRQGLENVFAVRPRTKEFLFGQPLLFAGFFLRSPILLLCGMIGQVSILNTFMHAHAPVALSLLRTGYGILLGLAIGIPLALAAARWLRRKQP